MCEIEKDLRPAGEIIRLLRTGVDEGSRVSKITEIHDWSQAIDAAWRELLPGELLLIQSCTIAKTVKKLQTMLGLEPAEVAA